MPHHKVASVADLLRRDCHDMVTVWLSRVSDRVTVDERFLFPSEDLLDHIPLLIEGIARALTGDEPITVDTPVVLKAKELGKLRFEQGFSAHQILWEYQLLGSIMLSRIEDSGLTFPALEAQQLVRRLFDALSAVQRATVDEFLDHYEETIHEREDRLRGFNHALSHELRNEMGAILGAARMLGEPFVAGHAEQRERFVRMVVDNAERVERLVKNLLELSRVEDDSRQHRNVTLRHAAEEVGRHLRRFADARGVEIRIGPLPEIEVNAAAVELALVNLVGNGIKYHDPDRPDRWVEIRSGGLERELVRVDVVDNGRGVPEPDRERLFERFFRSSLSHDIEGTGLGLHLVRVAVERAGGQAWAEFPDDGGCRFAFTLPARRESDAAAG